MSTENRQYPARPFAAIGVMVWNGTKFLIVKRAKAPRAGQWGLIGGAIELGEAHFQAAVREAKEELGIEIDPFAIITAIDGITKDASGKAEYHYSIVEVNARFVSGEFTPSDEISEARWVTAAEFDALHVWDEMRRVVHMASAQFLTN
jgi:8-oxo-dGTP pyrophosphatase MutT (NUDIX family)